MQATAQYIGMITIEEAATVTIGMGETDPMLKIGQTEAGMTMGALEEVSTIIVLTTDRITI